MPLLFIIFIILFAALSFLGHLFVYKILISIFAISSNSVLLWLKIFLIVFGIGFMAANVLAFQYNNAFIRAFYMITASWYGFLLYLILAGVIYVSVAALNFLPQPILPILGKLLVFLALITGIYGLWNAQHIVVTEYRVQNPKLAAWQGKKAVWVSDIHLDEVHGAEYSQKLVSAIEKENPDIVFIGGDLFDGTKVNERAVIAPFQKLKPKDGIYFITGNHEEFGDKTHFINAIKEAGIRVLDNEQVDIGGVSVIGVDDRDSTNRKTFEQILAHLIKGTNKPVILLKHQPLQLDIAEKSGILMQISGHTHEAQIFPLNFITKIIYKGYDYGRKQYGNMEVFVSDGVGTWGPPLRVGTKSEILVFDFK